MSILSLSGIRVRLGSRQIGIVSALFRRPRLKGVSSSADVAFAVSPNFHKMKHCLVRGDVLYLSDLGGIGVAPQIEAAADRLKSLGASTCLCVPFDDVVYLCHFENGMVSRERVLMPESARDEINSSGEKVAVLRCGALSEKFVAGGDAVLEVGLNFDGGARNPYRFRGLAFHLLRNGMISPSQMGALAVAVVGLVAFYFHPYSERAPQLVPEPVRKIARLPEIHTASAASALHELAAAVHDLAPVAARLGVSKLHLKNDELQITGRSSGVWNTEALAARFGFKDKPRAAGRDFDWRRRLRAVADEAPLPSAEKFSQLMDKLRHTGAVGDVDWRSSELAVAREYRISAHIGRSLVASLHALSAFSERLPMRLLKAEVDYGADGFPRGVALSLLLRTKK